MTIPAAAVRRMSLYLRELQRLVSEDIPNVNSDQLAQILDIKGAQIRKDLSHLGRIGQPGVGYRCDELIEHIRGVLGTHRAWRVALLGAGNLGRALLGYRGFATQGFEITDAFDVDPSKIGDSIGHVRIHSMATLASVVAKKQIQLGILAVPASEASATAHAARAAGIEGLLNFAPLTLTSVDGCCVVSVDLAQQLEQLAFTVVSRNATG